MHCLQWRNLFTSVFYQYRSDQALLLRPRRRSLIVTTMYKAHSRERIPPKSGEDFLPCLCSQKMLSSNQMAFPKANLVEASLQANKMVSTNSFPEEEIAETPSSPCMFSKLFSSPARLIKRTASRVSSQHCLVYTPQTDDGEQAERKRWS